MNNPNCVKQELYFTPFIFLGNFFLIGNGNFPSKKKEIVHYRKIKTSTHLIELSSYDMKSST